MSLSTHVLDTARGRPAPGLQVTCERRDGDGWQHLTTRETNDDGRIGDLLGREELTAGVHRLTFATGAWAAAHGRETFWPEVTVTFEIAAPDEHHHVPLLLSPFGYSTYRGS
ncbi:hydroxyisourate hydrolase [Egibacter rhizosphaerae]|uniref:5-hydroxyisourate hydrolase n=1 Tax=Egibacter rhizosphaerae TaxID=1670831 RepID=A0A411YEV3_9ACTN|nr:hydroxyisourate hydrolase [Egibacter rhizosphaerae]QBI19748.1 hydroxyisourate hydrolase [Egibacter rhizosphaerae]